MNPTFLAILSIAAAAPATAQDVAPAQALGLDDSRGARRVALGVEVDLLPPVMSAVAGTAGFSGQAWAGEGHWRLRLVGAHFRYPDGLLDSDAFSRRDATVLALICDRFLLPGFRGPWVGAGAEIWWSSIGDVAGPQRADWTQAVLTVGGGYVWKVWGNLYLNPWAAAHWTTTDRTLTLYGNTFHPARLSAEASLKVGWFLWM